MRFKITIIIPVYNVEAFVLKCLQSVSSQTVSKGIECLIVDDKGTDNSMAIVDEFVMRYKGDICFSIIHHDQNKGLSESRNTGMAVAQGDYVYFLDSDDTIGPDCMEEMIYLVEKYPHVDMVIGNNDLNDIIHLPFGEFTNDTSIIRRNLLFFNGRTVAAQRHMVRMGVIKDSNLKFYPGIIHEDNLWTFMLAKHIKSIAFSAKDQYHYNTENLNSITRSRKIYKEIIAYRTIVEMTCKNVDSFLPGTQKSYIFQNVCVALKNCYYENEVERRNLVRCLTDISNWPERLLADIYFFCHNQFVKRISLALLNRLYLLSDKQ